MTISGNGGKIAAYFFWKESAIALAAIIFAVGGSWFAFGRDAVTAAEVRNLIALNSPYALDRGQIQSALTQDQRQLDSLEAEHHQLLLDLAQVRVDIARIEQKLNIGTSGR